jgi:DNA-binding NarL/FixJ family response regulator
MERKTVSQNKSRTLVCFLSTHPLILPELLRFVGSLRAHSVARLLKISPTTDLHRLALPAAQVYVVDSHSTGLATEGLVAFIRGRRRNARVIVLAEQVTGMHSFPLLHLGVKGLICYDEVPQQLARAIQLVAKGGLWIPRKVMSDFLELLQSGKRVPQLQGVTRNLSRREKEVLDLLLKSLSNKEISSSLHISESTVKFHISNIFQCYGVQRRADLILQSLQENVTVH